MLDRFINIKDGLVSRKAQYDKTIKGLNCQLFELGCSVPHFLLKVILLLELGKLPFICAYSCSGIMVCAIICLRHNLNKDFLSWENYFGKKCFPFYSCRDGKRLCRNNKGQHFFGASLVGAHFLICSYFMLCKFREIYTA